MPKGTSTCLKSQVSGALCLGLSSPSKQLLPLEVLVLLSLTPPTTIFFLLFYRVLSEFLSTSVLVEAISSQCPGALPLAAFGDCSVSYGTNLLPQ